LSQGYAVGRDNGLLRKDALYLPNREIRGFFAQGDDKAGQPALSERYDYQVAPLDSTSQMFRDQVGESSAFQWTRAIKGHVGKGWNIIVQP
jgi:hypothetical protein